MRILEHSGNLKPVFFEFMQNLLGVGFLVIGGKLVLFKQFMNP